MSESVKVGLLGLGTVGSGVIKIIQDHQEKLQHQVGCAIEVKKVLVKDTSKQRSIYIDSDYLTVNVEDVLNDPDIDVVIEVMGGVEETRHHLLNALNQKKHVVTANKDLMALYGPELLQCAKDNGCDLYYEASVAGGIPIIRSLVEGLSSDHIQRVMGIVNGTTNYILTKMVEDQRTYEDVLQEAQDLGYAESDPTADVEGLDAARKMAILASLAFSMNIDLSDVTAKGISTLTKHDLDYARDLGYNVKLIGLADKTDHGVEISVEPTLLPLSHPLASVNGVFNAVYVYGAAVGETMFYGPGAGSLPTATAVVSDLVAIVKNLRLGVNGASVTAPQFTKKLKAETEIAHKQFLRLHVEDQAGVFLNIVSLFAEKGISLEKVAQRPLKKENLAEIVLITHEATRNDFNEVLSSLKGLQVVRDVKSVYRVLGRMDG